MKSKTALVNDLPNRMEQMNNSEKSSTAGKFSLAFYLQSVTRLLGEPRKFFNDCTSQKTFNQSLGFLVVSSLFFTAASLASNMYLKPFTMGVIFFINAVGMTFVTAALGYLVMTMFMGRKVSFTRFFSIYAFASGITLLVSWVPFFSYLTEPWNWWLIGTGMTRGCGFSWKQAMVIIGVSIIILILAFWSTVPIVAELKQ